MISEPDLKTDELPSDQLSACLFFSGFRKASSIHCQFLMQLICNQGIVIAHFSWNQWC